MTELSTGELRSHAKADRHLARVERFLARQGVSLTVADRLSALVDAPVGADDQAIESAIASLRRDLPGVFGEAPRVDTPGGEQSKGLAEARRRFGSN